MPTIPTPFIGGSDTPQQDRAGKTEIEPPFYTEESAAEVTEEAVLEAESGTEVAEAAPTLEPEASEYEGPVPVERPSVVEEPSPIEEVAAEAEAEPALAAPTTGAAPPEATEPEDDAAPPDYLFGPDWVAAEEPAEGAMAGPPALAAPESLARKAEELLEGAHGDRIRKLVADLGSSAADVAVPRAFAAGYLAAQSGEEN